MRTKVSGKRVISLILEIPVSLRLEFFFHSISQRKGSSFRVLTHKVIKITTSCELRVAISEEKIASCEFHDKKTKIVSCKMHFKKLKVRVANFKVRVANLKVQVANYK